MITRDKIFKMCRRIYPGQKFEFMNYDLFVKNPFIFDGILEHLDTINGLYLALKNSNLPLLERNPSGSLKAHNIRNAGGAWDVRQVVTHVGQFKGIIITVIVKGYVFVFKCGNFKVKNSDLSGRRAFRKFSRVCELNGINLDKYKTKSGFDLKKEIEQPIIRMFKCYKKYNGVHHIDFNNAWCAGVCEVYPEFKPVFKTLREQDKLIGDIALGFCQSEYNDYSLTALAKAGINTTNKNVRDMWVNLVENGFTVLGINTDGIWYVDEMNPGRLYSDENEGLELGQWKTDHKNCDFMAYSDGQYWFRENGVFNVRARGSYAYETIKARKDWDEEDFDKAMGTLVEFAWDEERGLIEV